MKPYDAIISLLKTNDISYEEIEHKPVSTSEEAAAVRGLSMKEGAKSLLIKAGSTFYLLIIPGDRRLDSKKVKKLLSVKSFRFATPEEVVSVMKCEIGSCYPFGEIIHIEHYVDSSFSENEYISFNPGVHTKSIRMRWVDYSTLIGAKITLLTQEVAGKETS